MEMSPPHAEVIPADASDVTYAGTIDMGRAQSVDVCCAESIDVSSTEATDVTCAKATHVAATKASAKATTVSAATTAAAGLRIGGNEASGEQCGCQNRHQSSSHHLSPWNGADIPPQDLCQAPARLDNVSVDTTITGRWEFTSVVPIKFCVNQRIEYSAFTVNAPTVRGEVQELSTGSS